MVEILYDASYFWPENAADVSPSARPFISITWESEFTISPKDGRVSLFWRENTADVSPPPFISNERIYLILAPMTVEFLDDASSFWRENAPRVSPPV